MNITDAYNINNCTVTNARWPRLLLITAYSRFEDNEFTLREILAVLSELQPGLGLSLQSAERALHGLVMSNLFIPAREQIQARTYSRRRDTVWMINPEYREAVIVATANSYKEYKYIANLIEERMKTCQM